MSSVLTPPTHFASTEICLRGQAVHSDVSDELLVLQAGALLVEYRTLCGRSFVLDFLFPGQVAGVSTTLVEREAATVQVIAVEDSRFLRWTRSVVEQSGETFSWPELQQHLKDLAIARNSRRFLSLLTQSALDRYIGLDQEFPPDRHRLPQNLIASYLGITPQYLCHLRRLANSRSQ